jgi:hypothetical protein
MGQDIERIPYVALHVVPAVAKRADDRRTPAEELGDLEMLGADVLKLQPLCAQRAHHGPALVAFVAEAHVFRTHALVDHMHHQQQGLVEAKHVIVRGRGPHDGRHRLSGRRLHLAHDADVELADFFVEALFLYLDFGWGFSHGVNALKDGDWVVLSSFFEEKNTERNQNKTQNKPN